MIIDTKRKIVDVTFTLSLKNGFDNVSIKQIQNEANLSAGSIYYHFKDKDEILTSMVDIYLKDGVNQLREDVKNFEGSLIEKIDFIFNYKAISFLENKIDSSYHISDESQFNRKDYWVLLTSVYHQHPEIRSEFYEIHDELYGLYYELIQEAIEKKEIRDDIDVKTLTLFIHSCLKGYLDLWVYQPNLSFEELVDSNIKMIWEAIKKR